MADAGDGEPHLTVIDINVREVDDVEIQDRGPTDRPVCTTVEVDGFSTPPRVLEGGDRRPTSSQPPNDNAAELDVVEWTNDMGRPLFLCDHGGTALGELQAGVHAARFLTASLPRHGRIARSR